MTTTLVSLLEARFVDRRDEIAVICGDSRLTYGELDRASAALARWLDHHDVAPRATVGLTLERSAAQVVWVVAIVRSGRALCFLDREHPAAWNRDVIVRAELRHVVGPPIAGLDTAVTWIASEPATGSVDAPRPGPVVEPDDRVYVNFSSGTTGAPKVIPCLHRGVVAFCHAPRHLPIDATARVVYSSPLTFDASQLELWLPLVNGGCVVVNDRHHLTVSALRRLIDDHGANTLWLTTSLFNALVDIDPDSMSGLRTLIVGGEELSPGHIQALQRAQPDIAVFNGYGPTETTIIATIYPIPHGFPVDEPLPIGWPIASTRGFVVAADGRACHDGEIGELWISGDGVSPGYLGDPALTAARYVVRDVDGAAMRCYRTGDLVSRDGTGLLRYHGRIDDQLKIRGHRVVLSEVALAYAAHPRIRSCVALVRARGANRSLVVFYVPDAPDLDAAEIAAFMRDRLPAFMQALELVAVPALPLRANGKINRDRLLAHTAAPAHSSCAPNDTPEVAALRQLAGLPDWPVTASFFAAGGDSLGAIRLIGALDRAGPGAPTIEEFYRAPRLCDVLARLPPGLAVLASEPTAPAATQVSFAPVPLTPAQLTMLYPEVLRGDATRNGVVYVFERDFGEVALEPIEAALQRRFPLLASVVIEDDTGYAFIPGAPPAALDRAVLRFASAAACAQHWLDVPLPLGAGPLLRLFRCQIAGRHHHGVLLHHILGDHLGQLELLRASQALLASDGRAELGAPDVAYAAVNPRITARCEAERDACVKAWQRKHLVGTPAPAAVPGRVLKRHRLRGRYPDRAPSQQLLVCLAATRAGLAAAFGVREPLVFTLFSLREGTGGLGFQTVLAPVALRDELFLQGHPGPRLLDELLETRRHAVIGMEDILVAAGLAPGDVPFLFNFVDMRVEDHRWIADHLVDGGTEPARTLLDVTVLRAGTTLEVTLNGSCAPAQAAEFTRAFDAVVCGHAG